MKTQTIISSELILQVAGMVTRFMDDYKSWELSTVFDVEKETITIIDIDKNTVLLSEDFE